MAPRDAGLAEVRRRDVVAHHQDTLFSGRLADEVRLDRPRHSPIDARVELDTALWAADAAYVVAGLDAALDEPLTERGRPLSGGQRPMLARALTADPDALVLDDPTSAVDAHTEARITRRVAELRRPRTTVVLSASRLWAAAANQVIDSQDGAVHPANGGTTRS